MGEKLRSVRDRLQHQSAILLILVHIHAEVLRTSEYLAHHRHLRTGPGRAAPMHPCGDHVTLPGRVVGYVSQRGEDQGRRVRVAELVVQFDHEADAKPERAGLNLSRLPGWCPAHPSFRDWPGLCRQRAEPWPAARAARRCGWRTGRSSKCSPAAGTGGRQQAIDDLLLRLSPVQSHACVSMSPKDVAQKGHDGKHTD